MVLASPSACLLYTDSINMPPQVTIEVQTPEPFFRGVDVTFKAKATDPDEDPSRLHVSWRHGENCGKARVNDEAAAASTFTFQPEKLGDHCVVTRVTDSLGAFVEKNTTFKVVNQAPKVVLDVAGPVSQTQTSGYPLNSRIRVSAEKSVDPDPDQTNQLTFAWTLLRPNGETADVTEGCPSKFCSFVAEQPGAYAIRVTATDSDGAAASTEKAITIANDSVPCIIGVSPDLSPRLSADEDQLFIVTQVEDDVDPYPAQSSNSASQGSFQWLFRTSTNLTAEWQALSPLFALNTITIPRGFVSAGSTIQVRVMYSDRIKRDFSKCWEGSGDRCELSAGCAQGLTWTVTFR
jgi:hypothetical protein